MSNASSGENYLLEVLDWMRILIVDNNLELCHALQEYLETQLDLEVVGLAHDGEKALTQIQNLQPDVMLLDITMPYLDGLGVLERLQTLGVKKPTVFVITAFSADSLLARIMDLGVDYFLVKPFKLEILAQRLRQFSNESAGMISESASAIDSKLSTEQQLTKLLHSMGVPPHYKGFSYLKQAVLLSIDDGYYAGGLTKDIYPTLAKRYHTTASGVEAAIRNAVVAAWEHGNKGVIQTLCEPYCEEKMPTNSLIIAKIAEVSQDY